MPDQIILQKKSVDGGDGSRAWTAQWTAPPYHTPYPGPENGQPDMVDPRG